MAELPTEEQRFQPINHFPIQRAGVIGLAGIRAEKRNDPYFRLLISGIQEAADTHNYRVVLQEQDTPLEYHKIDGLLLTSNTVLSSSLVPAQLPCVSMLYHRVGIPAVLVDEFNAGAIATRHLLELEHQQIAFLADPHQPQVAERISGYRSALQEAGIAPQQSWVHPLRQSDSPYEYFREWGCASMRDWLLTTWGENKFTALLVQNDWVGAGAVKALQEHGLRIPYDVAVVGFDNLDICRQIKPTLSSVEAPLRDIGRQSVEVLLQIINGKRTIYETLLLPARLCIRQSSVDSGYNTD